jgi:AcrR family transcriptional regulator
MKSAATRSYVMRARAESAAATRERILESARDLLLTHSFEDMTIEAIAAGAETTVRTVMRLFGSKPELFAQALHGLGQFRFLDPAAPEFDRIETLVRSAYGFYEKVGDTVIRWLADEPRVPAMQQHLAIGRQHLRDWVTAAFATELQHSELVARKELLDGLIVAFDVYSWKLLRRDFGLSRRRAEATTRRMVRALIGEREHG